MGVGFADELAFLESLDQQESNGALQCKEAATEATKDAHDAINNLEKSDNASRGAAIAKAVDPTAELDLLDSLAKEAGIEIKAESKPGGNAPGDSSVSCHG